VLIGLLILLFAQALPGQIHFDDQGNLAGLAAIESWSEALSWIQEGIAGPLGRPLALATFALQHDQWPDPAPFLVWNIALHIINALLVMWLAWLCGQRLGWTPHRALAVAWLTGLAWAALPLLNTTVLFIVQRMSVLSATGVLLGLVLYLKLRDDAHAGWLRQLAALAVLGMAGVAAILSKESGAMIVLYALILEAALLHRAAQKRPSFALVMLVTANLVLLFFLLRYFVWSPCTELQRGYDVWQRLGSQGWMLLAYLKDLVLPTLSELNPFRFEHVGEYGNLLLWGIPVWLSLMLVPVLLWLLGWRLAALTAAWFFYGHLMESSWLSLEPYFAHRNYLPILLPVFVLVAWVMNAKHHTILKRSGLLLYIAMLASVTWMNTTLWGQRELAAEIWFKEEPKSTRAALNLSHVLDENYGIHKAQAFLDNFMLNSRDSAGLRIQRLITACSLTPEIDHSELARDVLTAIPRLPFEGWASGNVENLAERLSTHSCKGVTEVTLAEIASAFLDNQRYACSANISHNMLMTIGGAAWQGGDYRAALNFWLNALENSISYPTTAIVLDKAQVVGDYDALSRLLLLIQSSATPNGATHQEWQELILQVREADLVGKSRSNPSSAGKLTP